MLTLEISKRTPEEIFDWEMGRIACNNNLNEGVDRLEWIKDTKGNFSVKSAYKELNIAVVQEEIGSFDT